MADLRFSRNLGSALEVSLKDSHQNVFHFSGGKVQQSVDLVLASESRGEKQRQRTNKAVDCILRLGGISFIDRDNNATSEFDKLDISATIPGSANLQLPPDSVCFSVRGERQLDNAILFGLLHKFSVFLPADLFLVEGEKYRSGKVGLSGEIRSGDRSHGANVIEVQFEVVELAPVGHFEHHRLEVIFGIEVFIDNRRFCLDANPATGFLRFFWHLQKFHVLLEGIRNFPFIAEVQPDNPIVYWLVNNLQFLEFMFDRQFFNKLRVDLPQCSPWSGHPDPDSTARLDILVSGNETPN